jgi:septal ring-binding cell division protein DamX
MCYQDFIDMNQKIILCASVLLTACSSGTYVTDVKTDTFQQDYNAQSIDTPLMAEPSSIGSETPIMTIKEVNVTPTPPPAPMPQSQAGFVKIEPPTAKQLKAAARFGYTIQVAAVATEAKVRDFAGRLPQNVAPIWQNYKLVKGTKWYTVLYGDYATKSEAQAAIATLPQDLRRLKPFVKSIDTIKNSDYPELRKLN